MSLLLSELVLDVGTEGNRTLLLHAVLGVVAAEGYELLADGTTSVRLPLTNLVQGKKPYRPSPGSTSCDGWYNIALSKPCFCFHYILHLQIPNYGATRALQQNREGGERHTSYG